jgi:hypothetical protein
MKKAPKLLLLYFLSTTIGLAQSLSVDHARQVHRVFIESEVDDAVHLALSSTTIGWTRDRGSADLVLKFDRAVSSTDTSAQGSATKTEIHWTYTLIASSPDGVILHQYSTPENLAVRSDKSEVGWLNYLRSTPEYTLTKKLTSQLQK